MKDLGNADEASKEIEQWETRFGNQNYVHHSSAVVTDVSQQEYLGNSLHVTADWEKVTCQDCLRSKQ